MSRDEVHGETQRCPLRVLVADDHPLMLAGLRRLLEDEDEIEVVGQAGSGPELIGLIERRAPDLVVTDMRMPGFEGADSLRSVHERWPELKLVVLSASEHPADIDAALSAGARAYAVKSAKTSDIASIVRLASSGAVFHGLPVARGASAWPVRPDAADGGSAAPSEEDPELTEREEKVLAAVAQGLTTKEISRELWISEHTVKFHLTNIYRKLGVANRSGAVRYAIEHGMAA